MSSTTGEEPGSFPGDTCFKGGAAETADWAAESRTNAGGARASDEVEEEDADGEGSDDDEEDEDAGEHEAEDDPSPDDALLHLDTREDR